MKFLIFTLMALLSNPTFAKHIYLDVQCSNADYELKYNSNYLTDNIYEITHKKSGDSYVAHSINGLDIESDLLFDENLPKGILFAEKTLAKYSYNYKKECDYDEEVTKDLQLITLTEVPTKTNNPETKKGQHFKKGQKLTMKCITTISYPSDPCSEND